MSTPPAHKTTFSSRMKMAATIQVNGQGPFKHKDNISSNMANGRIKSGLQPPSQLIKNRITATPHITSINSKSATRLARLVNGLPSTISDGNNQTFLAKQSNYNTTTSTASIASSNDASSRAISTTINDDHGRLEPKNKTMQLPNSRILLKTDVKPNRFTSRPMGLPKTSSRILAPNSRLSNTVNLNSRSSSILSNISTGNHSNRQPLKSSSIGENKPPAEQTPNVIPSIATARKGLARFANPIECQRQFQALTSRIKDLEEVNQSRASEISELQDRLESAVNVGSGYATTVQYLAEKLKLFDKTDLETECENLRKLVSQLKAEQDQFDCKVDEIVRDYKNHIQIEHDLKRSLEQDLENMRIAHSSELEDLKSSHELKFNDLIKNHTEIEQNLKTRIHSLESELDLRSKELSDLRKEHEQLNNNFNKLEETLTKDKDARVKYAQEKISQLQKDVESINSVLEMRLERIRALEKDSLLLVEVRNELALREDTVKALKQQIESLHATLENRKEQYDSLIADHDKISQELKRERRERRRMTMRTEQLEYVLNESCASESNKTFDTSIRDLEGSDHVV